MEQARLPVSPAVLASVPDHSGTIIKSSVATESDFVSSLQYAQPDPIHPTTGPVAPENFTNMDYDAADDALIELYSWQPEDDSCLRELVGTAADANADWKSIATQFNQKRGGSQETESLQHQHAHTQNQIPNARTDKALQARWDQLQKLKNDTTNDLVENGVKCSVCEHNFTYSEVSTENIDEVVDKQDGFVCEFCMKIGATDIYSTSWGMHAEMSEELVDPTKPLDFVSVDDPELSWEDDGFQDALAGAPKSPEEQHPQVPFRKKRRYEVRDQENEQVSSDDETGEFIRHQHLQDSLQSKQRFLGVSTELAALELQQTDENDHIDLASALYDADSNHGWWL